MAQLIRIYSSGGNTEALPTLPPGKRVPTMIVDGQEIELTDDLQRHIRQRAASLGGNAGYWLGKNLDAALAGGASVNTGTHEINSNVDYSSLNQAQQRRMSKLVNRGSKKLGDAKTGAYEFVEAIRTYSPAQNTSDKKEKIDHSSNLGFEYEVDDKGNYRVSDAGTKFWINTLDNTEAYNRLASLREILNRTDEFDFSGYNGRTLQNYKDWYNTYTPAEFDALLNRIKTGAFTDADIEVLSDLGYSIGKTGGGKTSSSVNPAVATTYAGSTWKPEDWISSGYAQQGDDGYLYITDSGKSVFGNGNLWLNDSYRVDHPEGAKFIPEGNGLFVIDGKIYNSSDEALLNQKIYRDFVNANREFRYNDANSLIKQYHYTGHGPQYVNLLRDPSTGNKVYSHTFGHKDIYGRHATNEYEPVYDENGKQLFVYEYLDENAANDPTSRDAFGHVKADRLSVIAIDPNTGRKVEVDPAVFKRMSASKDYGLTGNIYSPYYQPAEGLNLIKPYGTVQGANWSYYYDPETEAYYYQSNETWPDRSDKLSSEYTKNPTQYIHRVPEEIVNIIKSNPNKLKDPKVREVIMLYLQSPYLSELNDKDLITSRSLAENYPELHALIDNYITRRGTYRNGNIPDNHLYEVSNTMLVQSQGGVLKAQLGARMTAAETPKIVAKEKEVKDPLHKKVRAYGTEKVIGDKTEWTSADLADLGALGADLVGLGVGFVPGAHIGGAVVGFLGSSAGLYADIKRDGFQWRDLGEFGLNAAMDVGSLFAGSAAKAAKVAGISKTITRLAPKLISAANVLGIGSAASTAISNFQDGTWTIDDLRTMTNLVQGLRNFRRTANPTKKVEVNDVTLHHKTNKDLDLSLSKSEIDQINALPEGQRADAIDKALTASYNRKHKTDLGKYKEAETEFNKLIEQNKIDAGKENSTTKLWDNTEIAKQRAEFYQSKGLDPNFKQPEISFTQYEGIDYRPERAHWYSPSLPGKKPKITISTTQKVPLQINDSSSTWDTVHHWWGTPGLQNQRAIEVLDDLNVTARNAYKNKPAQRVSRPTEYLEKVNVPERPTVEPPIVTEDRVEYLRKLGLKLIPENVTGPKKPDILNQDRKVLVTNVENAKTKKQRQQANSALSDYDIADAKYKKEVADFVARKQKVDNALAQYDAKVDARNSYEQAIAQIEEAKRHNDRVPKNQEEWKRYAEFERALKAYNAAKKIRLRSPIHLLANNPNQQAPIYAKPLPGYYVQYKKGGKVIKGQGGVTAPKITTDYSKIAEVAKAAAANSAQRTLADYNAETKTMIDTLSGNYATTTLAPRISLNQAALPYNFDPFTNNETPSKKIVGQLTKTGNQNNLGGLADSVLGVVGYYSAKNANKKITDLNIKAAKHNLQSQVKSPYRGIAPTLSASPLREYDALNKQIVAEKNRALKTSDAGINLARDLAMDEQALKLQGQAQNAWSKNVDSYNDKLNKFLNEENRLNYQIAENNRAIGEQQKAAEYTYKAQQHLADKAAAQAKIAEIRNNIAEDRLLDSQKAAYDDRMEASALGRSMIDNFNKLSAEERKAYSSWKDWAEKNDPTNYVKYTDLIYKASNPSYANLKNYAFLDGMFGNLGKSLVSFSKKGTKVTPLWEKLALEGNKNVQKSAIKISDNLTKILLKLMK